MQNDRNAESLEHVMASELHGQVPSEPVGDSTMIIAQLEASLCNISEKPGRWSRAAPLTACGEVRTKKG